jgi:hypothetical protein
MGIRRNWANSSKGRMSIKGALLDMRADKFRAKITDRQPEVVEFAEGLKKDGFEKVSLLGYCWGQSSPIRSGDYVNGDADDQVEKSLSSPLLIPNHSTQER